MTELLDIQIALENLAHPTEIHQFTRSIGLDDNSTNVRAIGYIARFAGCDTKSVRYNVSNKTVTKTIIYPR